MTHPCITDQSSFLFLVGYPGIDDYPNTLSPWPWSDLYYIMVYVFAHAIYLLIYLPS